MIKMAYQKQTYQDGVTEYTDTLYQHMDDGIFGAYPVQLIAISDTAPSQCVENDKYYNTSTKKIYTATGTNTWGTNGETPLEDTAYWLISENGSYAWNGTDLVSIGGGKAEVVISDEEPEEGKLWVDTAEIPTIAGRDRLVNVSNEVDEDYRVNIKLPKNLLNIDDVTRDYYYTQEGVYIYSSGSGLTDYMEVEANTEYVFKGISSQNSNRRINYFDSNKQWLSQDVQLATSEDVIITTPANTKYVRISYYSPTMNENTLGFYKTPYKAPSIYVDNDEIYSKPVVLYNQTASSATTSLTLNDDISNYLYIEVFGRTNNSGTFYKKIDTSSSSFTIDVSTPITGSLTIQEYVNLYSMSGTTISCTRYLRNNYTNGTTNVVSETNGIYIDKVIGYK